MKNLIFDELLLLSDLQKTGKRVPFDRHRTLIVGENETGKSQLVKSLYACFGVTAAVRDAIWESLEVRALLKFRVDAVEYRILHRGHSITLFDLKGKLLGAFNAGEDAWARRVSELFDFRLEFYSASGSKRIAPPQYLFAPFYIDQDKGWSGPWSSLAKLKASRRQDAIEYHVGIRPNSYFDAKARVHSLQHSIREPEGQRAAIERLLSELGTEASEPSAFTTDSAAFAAELDRLMDSCRVLQVEQLGFRDRLVALENERIGVRKEIEVIKRAQFEFRKDYEYAASYISDQIECPLCGAEYKNGALERFLIAQDEDRCSDLVLRLAEEDERLSGLIAEEEARYSSVTSQLSELTAALESKQKQVTLQDVIKAEGKRELRSNLQRNLDLMIRTTDELSLSLMEAKREMKAATDRKLRKEILAEYGRHISDLALQLQVSPLTPQMSKKIAPRVAEGGSDFPRRLMAYFVAILRTIRTRTSSTFCPIVIDTVNQQDQAAGNLEKMFQLLATGLPAGSQLIFASVSTRGVSFAGTTIKLDQPFSLLTTNEYASVADEIRPYNNARHAHDLAQERAKNASEPPTV